jgi:protein-tyrosine phosphatase
MSQISISDDAINRQAERLMVYNALPLQKKAQKIVDNLYLGPLQIAENEDDISNLGLTAILSVLGFAQNEDFNHTSSGVKRMWVCVEDRVESEATMRTSLPDAVATIHHWISAENEVVYVHCQSGISRSATVVIAYIMKHHGLSLMDSYKLVFDARPVINPNDGFFRALQDYAAAECGVDYDSGNGQCRETDLLLYNAYQLTAQLAFTGVTVDVAMRALDAQDGDLSAAAGRILSRFEHAR